MKREIKSHKGGRTARLYGCRITPEANEQLKEILATRKISLADWVEEKVRLEPAQHKANHDGGYICKGCGADMWRANEGDQHCSLCGCDEWIPRS